MPLIREFKIQSSDEMQVHAKNLVHERLANLVKRASGKNAYAILGLTGSQGYGKSLYSQAVIDTLLEQDDYQTDIEYSDIDGKYRVAWFNAVNVSSFAQILWYDRQANRGPIRAMPERVLPGLTIVEHAQFIPDFKIDSMIRIKLGDRLTHRNLHVTLADPEPVFIPLKHDRLS